MMRLSERRPGGLRPGVGPCPPSPSPASGPLHSATGMPVARPGARPRPGLSPLKISHMQWRPPLRRRWVRKHDAGRGPGPGILNAVDDFDWSVIITTGPSVSRLDASMMTLSA